MLTVIGIIVAIVVVSAIGFGAAAYQACEVAGFTGTVVVNGNEVACNTLGG